MKAMLPDSKDHAFFPKSKLYILYQKWNLISQKKLVTIDNDWHYDMCGWDKDIITALEVEPEIENKTIHI